MSILHPWPRVTGKYVSHGPHYVALGPPWCRPWPSSSAQKASGGIKGASSDIIVGPWAAYFPVSLCQGCNIVIMFHSRAGHWQCWNPISACQYDDVDITPLALRHWRICRPWATLGYPQPPRMLFSTLKLCSAGLERHPGGLWQNNVWPFGLLRDIIPMQRIRKMNLKNWTFKKKLKMLRERMRNIKIIQTSLGGRKLLQNNIMKNIA